MEWVRRWGYEMSVEPVRPGVYRLRTGGHFVTVRLVNPRTGRPKTHQKVLRDATVAEAQRYRDEQKVDIRARQLGRAKPRQRFSDFAVSLLEAKLQAGDIKSAKGREKWTSVLEHHLIPAFGDIFCTELRHADIADWRERMAASGYAPSTVNGWLSVLRVICIAMKAKHVLAIDPCEGVANLDTSQAETYTEEAPNALTTDRAARFLERMRADFPQHYAMTLLGFVTGKRPSTLRPLRRSGPEADIDWESGRVVFRRSNSLGQAVMHGTKTRRREVVYVPPDVLDVLRAHVAVLEDPPLSKWGKAPLWWRPKMAESALLFPARHGGFRARSCLDAPFAEVSRAIGLPFVLSPRGMRRTFNDLARLAGIDSVVTRSISGHLTDAMREHYSTAQQDEQRAAVGAILSLVGQGLSQKAGKKAGRSTEEGDA